MRKLLSAPAFQFKGSGWYVTDYARKGSGDAAKAPTSAEGDAKSSGSDAATGGSDGKAGSTTPAKSSGGNGE
jgi:predicted nucleic acid-binding Zn ribbon protein